MASVKATFTLDPETVTRLGETAERVQRSKSAVVREAILDYSERVDRLSERERKQMLAAFDELVGRIPERPTEAVEEELEAIRRARAGGGRSGNRR
ncbi:MAG TPA: ribbon-helix-helix protein, CopG family [Polyangia bacterium]|jgi:predicted transcriptional regulator|nr:ribbon-helix-helix protein, CopG family [Polyangia bacterium]